MYIRRCIQKVAKNTKEFGGYKVLWLGDANQLKCIGDKEIYTPQNQDDLIDTLMEHNNIIEEENEGNVDIERVEREVADKQRDQIYEINGNRADNPKKEQNKNVFDEAIKEVKKRNKKEVLVKKLREVVLRFYNTLYEYMHTNCFELLQSER